jgi:hypothetical protein
MTSALPVVSAGPSESLAAAHPCSKRVIACAFLKITKKPQRKSHEAIEAL